MPNPVIPGADATTGMYSVRDEPPSHFIFKIDGFSLIPKLLLEDNLERYESKDFTVGCYKWNLSFYPTGDYKRDGADHISLFLSLSKNNTLPPGWELDVVYAFFVYNYNDNNYVTVRDGKVWHLNQLRRECGFAKLLTLSAFEDGSNGYLSNEDSCALGVEVFAIKSQGKGERLSIIKNPTGGSFSFTVKKFFGSNVAERLSDLHSVAGRKWRLDVYPNGYSEARAEFVSVFLSWADSDSDRKGKKVFAKFTLRIKDQVNGNDVVYRRIKLFDESTLGFGDNKFMSISDIKRNKGFLIRDTCIVEAAIDLISEVYDM